MRVGRANGASHAVLRSNSKALELGLGEIGIGRDDRDGGITDLDERILFGLRGLRERDWMRMDAAPTELGIDLPGGGPELAIRRGDSARWIGADDRTHRVAALQD